MPDKKFDNPMPDTVSDIDPKNLYALKIAKLGFFNLGPILSS